MMIMMIKIIIENSNESEVTVVAENQQKFNIPLSLLPKSISVGQSLWLSITDSPSSTIPAPKDILNELLHSDETSQIT